MQDEQNKSALEGAVDALEAHGARYLVIGGQAEYLFGSPRVTFDVDICYERSKENLARLALALNDVHAKLRGVPEDVRFLLDAASLLAGNNFTFETDIGPLDILGYVEPIGEFPALAQNAEEYQFGRYRIRTISLDNLLKIKLHINRPKDQESILQLKAIQRIRGEKK